MPLPRSHPSTPPSMIEDHSIDFSLSVFFQHFQFWFRFKFWTRFYRILGRIFDKRHVQCWIVSQGGSRSSRSIFDLSSSASNTSDSSFVKSQLLLSSIFLAHAEEKHVVQFIFLSNFKKATESSYSVGRSAEQTSPPSAGQKNDSILFHKLTRGTAGKYFSSDNIQKKVKHIHSKNRNVL